MQMLYIGDVGVIDDVTISLFQCPKCKTVKTNPWIDGSDVECPVCIGRMK